MNQDIPDHEIEQALALFYDGGAAPVITEKRTGEEASALITLALEAGIPIYENPELLAQLSELTIGEQVPPELYRLVAEVLAFAFFMQGKGPKGYDDMQ